MRYGAGKEIEMTERLSHAELFAMFDYDPATGALTWRHRDDVPPEWNTRHAGKPALACVTDRGYLHGRIHRQPYRAHRVIMCLLLGYWPEQVDHLNGNRSDNRIVNLRPVTAYEQARNKKRPRSNTSGYHGLRERKGRWQAYASSRYLGTFPTVEEALAARAEVQRSEGYHANHGRIV